MRFPVAVVSPWKPAVSWSRRRVSAAPVELSSGRLELHGHARAPGCWLRFETSRTGEMWPGEGASGGELRWLGPGPGELKRWL